MVDRLGHAAAHKPGDLEHLAAIGAAAKRLGALVDHANLVDVAIGHKAYVLKCKLIHYKGGACLDCGCSVKIPADTAVFDLHHRDPATKLFPLSHTSRYPWLKVLAEADKCDLLCANCHRRRHFGAGDVSHVTYEEATRDLP